MSRPTILVTGATGKQGGAVARHLLNSGVTIRALVRDAESAASRALANQGVELVTGEFGQPETLRRAMTGVNGVFSVQPLLLGKPQLEVKWGNEIADAAAVAGVSHFVYASVLGASLAPDVPHFASKAEIESHIQSIGIPHTILQPGGFMENLLMPVVFKGIAKGRLTTPNAVDSRQTLIAVDDIGAIAAKVFAEPAVYIGRKIPLVGEVLSTREQADVLTRVLKRPIKPGRLPGIVVRLFLGRDLYRMFQWTDKNSASVPFSTEDLRRMHPGLLTFEEWCRGHFGESFRVNPTP
jgi:uncharacterized protein YbjT (DUF2867 family)